MLTQRLSPLDALNRRSFWSAVKILDAFADTNGTALASHTIAPTNVPATAWTAHNGTWSISSNRAVQTGTLLVNTFATANAGIADSSVSADIVLPNTNDYAAGLALRLSDANNLWFTTLRRISGGTPEVVLYEVVSGGATLRANASNAAWVNGTFSLKAVLAGSTITVYVNNVQQAQYASATSNQTQTRHGLVSYTGSPFSQVPCDNFQVI